MKLHNILTTILKKDSKIWKILESIYSLNYFYSYFATHNLKLATTREIYFEFVSYCNLRCKLCSLDHTKPKVRMSIDTLNKIFDELFHDRRFRKIKIIHLHNAGEALLHPEFEKLISTINSQKERFKAAGYSFPKLALLTNASILKPALSDFIIKSNVFDFIRFSMDGGTPESFEQLRTRAKWNDFFTNVKYFLEKKKMLKNTIHAGFITMIDSAKKLSIKWMHPEFKELLSLADSHELRYPHNWGGEVTLEDGRDLSKKYKFGCSMLIKQLVFLPNGDVTMCCSDLNSKGVIGNINKMNLFDIYYSWKRLNTINLFYRRKKEQIELCKDCASY